MLRFIGVLFLYNFSYRYGQLMVRVRAALNIEYSLVVNYWIVGFVRGI